MYAALRTIVGHRGLPARICSPAVGEITTSLTNLGIVKNPHFSGDLHYPSPIRYDSGRFDIHLCHDMNLFEKVRLLRSLSNGRFWTMRKTRSWESAELTISSEVQFPVEFDGEVVVTKFARFSILPQYLKVCTC
jgi:diacylglycerol kinase family enzyme